MESPYGEVASAYLSRPAYPDELFKYIQDRCPNTGVVWDAGCGSGQASEHLVRYFDKVVATDKSYEQLSRARPHPRILYKCAPSEESGLKTGSVDCVCAFMAAHWFNLDKFYHEARRISAPGGLIVLVCYGEPFVASDQLVSDFLEDIASRIASFGGPAIQRMRAGYRDLPFPFTNEAQMPRMYAQRELSGRELVLYFRSRASIIDHRQRTGVDLCHELEQRLTTHGRNNAIYRLTWPLTGRVAPIHAIDTPYALTQQTVLNP